MNQFLIALIVTICALQIAEGGKAVLPLAQTKAMNAEGMQSLESIQGLPNEELNEFVDINRQRRFALREIVAQKDASWLPRLVQIIDQTHDFKGLKTHESQKYPVIDALFTFGTDAVEPIIAEIKKSPPGRKQRLLNYALQQILGPDETARLLASRSITPKLDDANDKEKIPYQEYRKSLEKVSPSHKPNL
jgi:hypothetical protein